MRTACAAAWRRKSPPMRLPQEPGSTSNPHRPGPRPVDAWKCWDPSGHHGKTTERNAGEASREVGCDVAGVKYLRPGLGGVPMATATGAGSGAAAIHTHVAMILPPPRQLTHGGISRPRVSYAGLDGQWRYMRSRHSAWKTGLQIRRATRSPPSKAHVHIERIASLPS